MALQVSLHQQRVRKRDGARAHECSSPSLPARPRYVRPVASQPWDGVVAGAVRVAGVRRLAR